MADISVMQGIHPSTAAQRTFSVQSQRMGTVGNDAASTPMQAIRESDENKRSKLEDVVSVSEYGDTLQVSDEGRKQLEDKAVSQEPVLQKPVVLENFQITVTPEERVDDVSLSESDDDEKGKMTPPSSYAGYTDMELEQMYLKGEISRYEFETEIAQREEEAKERVDDSDVGEIFRENWKAQEMKRTMNAILQIFSEQSSQKIDAQIRMDAVKSKDAIKRLEEENAQKQRIDQQMLRNENIHLWVS